MAGGLLAKSGKDSIDIAGHKIPIALIGAVVAVVGVVLFMRARSQGSSAAVGAVPANTGVNPVIDQFSSQASADAASLANLNQQLVGISQQLNAGPAAPAPAGPAPGTALPTNATVGGIRFGNVGNETTHGIFNAQGVQVGSLPFGAGVDITGAPVPITDPRGITNTEYPIVGPGGSVAYINSVDVGGFTPVTR